MPTYEYACTSCGEHLEVVQSFKDDPLTECPACGGPLKKVFAPIGVVFKGSGFYKTDSRSTSGAKKSGSSESTTTERSTSSDSSASSSGAKEPAPAKEGGGSGSSSSPAKAAS